MAHSWTEYWIPVILFLECTIGQVTLYLNIDRAKKYNHKKLDAVLKWNALEQRRTEHGSF